MSMDAAVQPLEVRRPRLLPWLALYFAAHVALRSAAPGTVDIDEGEQLVLTQWWQAGYGHQPPLYTWLQIIFFEAFGRSVFALSLLKNALMLLTYVFVHAAGTRLMGDRTRAGLGAMGLLLLPQAAWASQRDLTHSVLAMCLSAAIVWTFFLLMPRRSWRLHLAFGVAVGLGVLSKYNVLFLVVALLIGAIFSRQGRTAILRPAMLLSMAVAAAIVAPHALWLNEHAGVLRSAVEETRVPRLGGALQTLGSLGLAMLSAVGPAIAVMTIGFAPALRRRVEVNRLAYSGIALALAAGSLAIALALLMEMPHVKARWLQPVAIFAPMLLAAHLDPSKLTRARLNVFSAICAAVAVAVLALMAIRTLSPRFAERFEDHAFAFDQIASEIRTLLDGEPSVIASDFALIAGNLKHQFPDVPVFLPGVHDDDLVAEARPHGAIVIWEQNPRRRIPLAVQQMLQRIEPDRVARWPVREIEPEAGADVPSQAVAYIVLPPWDRAGATKPSSR